LSDILEFVILQLAGYIVPATLLVIIALGLNVQWGHTGLFNAGVAAFVGVGAYTFGMMSTGSYSNPGVSWYHWGPGMPFDIVTSAILAMAAAGILGALVAIPTLRLRADYLAIATLAFAEIVRLILKNERRLTGGDQSLAFIPRPFEPLVSRGPFSDGLFMLLITLMMLGLVLVLDYLTRSPFGRNLHAVREDEEAALALGKDTFRLKLGAFAIGCAVMGLAGALLASFNRVIVPDIFVPLTTFTAYVVVILGGVGNNRGIILGGYVFYLFTWTSQQMKAYLPFEWALRVDFLNQIVIGLLLILFILFRPEGVMPEKKYIPPSR